MISRSLQKIPFVPVDTSVAEEWEMVIFFPAACRACPSCAEISSLEPLEIIVFPATTAKLEESFMERLLPEMLISPEEEIPLSNDSMMMLELSVTVSTFAPSTGILIPVQLSSGSLSGCMAILIVELMI